MTLREGVLVVAALATALVSGANDGAALVALNTRTTAVPPLAAVGALSAIAGLGPLLVGTGVATTVARGLVAFERSGGSLGFPVAVVVALAVVFGSSRRGIPTSVTLALTGAIVGAGLGFGLPVHWAVVGAVAAAGIGAPLLAALAGALLASAELLLKPPALPRRARRLAEWAGFLLESFAYGANDAEKLVAVMAVALGDTAGALRLSLPGQAGMAALFAAGTLTTLRKVARQVSDRMVEIRSDTVLVVTMCASADVLASSALGYPISSTQAGTAALAGVGARTAPRRVQWGVAGAIAVSWVTTLPVAFGLGALLGLALRGLR